MLFMENKYTRWYNAIIFNAVNQNRSKNNICYYENHHIVPKSIGGSNTKNNLVLLTAREHFIVHLLLIKMVVDIQHKHKMIYAANRLANSVKMRSRTYEKIRKLYAECVSVNNKNRLVSDETKQKISLARIGIKLYRSKEHNIKIGLSQKNKERIYIQKENNPNYKGIIEQLDINNNVIAEYKGTKELLNSGFTKDVYYAISGKQKTHRGYKWRWKNE